VIVQLGPAPCKQCRALVWWATMPKLKSGTRRAWRNADGKLHRCKRANACVSWQDVNRIEFEYLP
jgi:hypothetical protein